MPLPKVSWMTDEQIADMNNPPRPKDIILRKNTGEYYEVISIENWVATCERIHIGRLINLWVTIKKIFREQKQKKFLKSQYIIMGRHRIGRE